MKKYKTEGYGIKITEVECVRETAKRVWIMVAWSGRPPRETMHSRHSEFTRYHDTWADAHAYLMKRTSSKVEWACAKYQEAQADHARVLHMTAPA